MQSIDSNLDSASDVRSQPPPQEAAIDALVHVAHRASSTAGFYQDVVPVLAACLRAVYVVLEVRSGAAPLRQSWNHTEIDPGFWGTKADTILTDTIVEGTAEARIFAGRDNELRVAFLCSPIGSLYGGNGAVVVAMPFRDPADVRSALAQLEMLCTLASSLVDSVEMTETNSRAAAGEASEETVGHIQKVAEFTSETELAFAITNRLRTRDSSEQVVLSTVSGIKTRILAVSGADTVSERTPGLKLLRGAAEECTDLKTIVLDQNEPLEHSPDINQGGRLHKRWRESTGGGCVASIPLILRNEVVAVLSVRRGSAQPFTDADLEELQTLVTPYGAGLEMVRYARRSLASHLWSSTRGALRACFTATSWGKKLLAAYALVLCGWAFYGSIDYSVKAPAKLRPIASRKLAAASDGVLMEVLVRPGDEVKKGDLLCRFDTSATELEHKRLMSELAILDVERYRALNGGSASEVRLTGARARAVQANVELIEYRLANASVRATVDGVIMTGDHRDRLGDSFPKGEMLFEIAENRGWMLDLEVTESDISDISLNLQGKFASHSKPEESHAFEITNIAPSALPRDGMNNFKVEAQCDLPSGWVRSGMAGYASIDVGTRSPAWVAFHRALDFARLHFWL